MDRSPRNWGAFFDARKVEVEGGQSYNTSDVSRQFSASARRHREAGTAKKVLPYGSSIRVFSTCASRRRTSFTFKLRAFTLKSPISRRADPRGILPYGNEHITEHSWTAPQEIGGRFFCPKKNSPGLLRGYMTHYAYSLISARLVCRPLCRS